MTGPRKRNRPTPSSHPPPSSRPPKAAGAPGPPQRQTEKLQKALARCGVGSRREMEAWIAAGRVTVNGQPAHLGQRVTAADRLAVDGRPVYARRDEATPRVLLYHKPAGEIVSAADPAGRPTVFDRLPRLRGGRWVAVGRLDFNSSGLLVFTTSGELAARLMHPRYEVEREYAVRVDGVLGAESLTALTQGVVLEDGLARFQTIADEGGQGRNHWYRVVLREGRNREVRRMLEAVGHTVTRLMRIRFGPFRLPPGLRRGQFRELGAQEVEALLQLRDQPAPGHGERSRKAPPARP